jgi:hypothetical protein
MEQQVVVTENGDHFSIIRAEDRDYTPGLSSPEQVEAVVNYETMPLEALAEARAYTSERITTLRNIIEEATLDLQGLDHELYRRMVANGGTALPHPDFEISYERKKTLVKNDVVFEEVRQLRDIPQKERDEIVSIVQPQPVVRTDAAALKKYAKKYGGSLLAILNRALTYVDGPIRVTVKRKDEVITTDEF